MKVSKRKLIKDADDWWSRAMRLSHYDEVGREGYKCFSCERYLTLTNSQAGHIVNRNYMSTRYDRNNCRIQCVVCNVVEKELGKMKMVLKLIDQGKKSLIDGLLERANKKPLREKVIVDTSSFYKRKTEELLKKHNIKSWWNK